MILWNLPETARYLILHTDICILEITGIIRSSGNMMLEISQVIADLRTILWRLVMDRLIDSEICTLVFQNISLFSVKRTGCEIRPLIVFSYF